MTPWWREAVVYQIYPRSFLDTNGDGVGDLNGITAKLDYLEWLGVDCLWLTPIYPSPMADFSYDVANYTDVEPLFGDLAIFDHLLAAAHGRGMKVILDWVPNHTSSQHPWFVDAVSSPSSAFRDFYIWKKGGAEGTPPNNWVRAWVDAPAWTYDETSGEWYLHCFLAEQPDLNWANPAVRAAMAETLRFWLDRGVDGFRMDVIHLLGKDPSFADDDEELKVLSHVVLNNRPETHPYLREIREVVKHYDGDPLIVGEVYLLDPVHVAEHYGNGDELDLAFNFQPLFTPWRAPAWKDTITAAYATHDPRHAWPTWVLNNHDASRVVSRLKSIERAKVAAVLLCTLRGTPFLYQGEELGLENAVLGDGEVIDPGFRDGARAPMPWGSGPGHGWPVAPWMTFPPNAATTNVEVERGDPTSMLTLYRDLIGVRKESTALRRGSFSWVDAPSELLVYRRSEGNDVRLIVCNFSHDSVGFSVDGRLDFATGRDHHEGFDGIVRGDEALIFSIPA